MGFVVVYDACVLYPAPLRDLLVRVGKAGLVQARWSHAILDECFHAIHRERPEVPEAALARTRRLMCAAVRDCLVEGFEPLVEGLTLPDPNDRHVLAAAIRAVAQTIVTRNLKDFPSDRLAPFGVHQTALRLPTWASATDHGLRRRLRRVRSVPRAASRSARPAGGKAGLVQAR